MGKLVHLRATTTYSLRKSVIRPQDLLKTAANQGCESLAITELGNLSSCVKIYKGAKEVGIKPILGCDLLIKSFDGKELSSHLTLLARNIKGWRNLLKILALSNTGNNVQYQTPTIQLSDIGDFSDGLIAYAGNSGSYIHRHLSNDFRSFIVSKEYSQAKSLVNPYWKQE